MDIYNKVLGISLKPDSDLFQAMPQYSQITAIKNEFKVIMNNRNDSQNYETTTQVKVQFFF